MYIWKRVSSGHYMNFNSDWVRDADIMDVERSLNYIYRFTGHHKDRVPLTVAQHSLLCLDLAVEAAPEDSLLHLQVFAHDFAEAYIGDVATPVKIAMGQAWKRFAQPIEQEVEEKFTGRALTHEEHERVKAYDLASLDIERRSMWRCQNGLNKWPTGPMDVGSLMKKEFLFERAQELKYVPVEEIWKELYDKAYK